MSNPHIAILGAGPVGLEAALAAVDAGLPFTVYETAPHAAGNVRRWGHVRLFTPWSMNISQRMRRHLEAAAVAVPDVAVPDGSECPTGDELADRLLAPLASLPSVGPNLATGTRVLSVARKGLLKHEEIATEERARQPFRLVVRGADGQERVDEADVVLDCTGTYAIANALGDGGVPAPGERAADARVVRHIPDVQAQPDAWAGKTLLVTGAGHSAQTAICDLADLAAEYPDTRIIWALRRAEPTFSIDLDDPLPERARLTRRAAAIARGESDAVEVLPGVTVDELAARDDGVVVTLASVDGSIVPRCVDLVVSLTGYAGDPGLYRQLQVHECYATSGPMKLAAELLGHGVDRLPGAGESRSRGTRQPRARLLHPRDQVLRP